MKIEQLEQAVKISELNSISLAAEELFISQPNLSLSVRKLEQELGYPLTTVVTGGLGGVVAPYCRRSVTYDADLLFRGMAALYEMNT